MKILVILGSPRRKGNSEAMTDIVVDELERLVEAETEYIRAASQTIAPCLGCGGCQKTGACVVEDEATALYAKVDEADLILLASPIYFYGVSAQLKAFIDRSQARWSRKYIVRQRFRRDDVRRGYLICTAATHGRKLFEGAILVAKSFFDAIDVDYGGSLLVRGVDGRGEAAANPAEVERARSFAREIGAAFTEASM